MQKQLSFTHLIILYHYIPLLCNTVGIEYHNISKENSAQEGPSRER
jgi:hypothetical protein